MASVTTHVLTVLVIFVALSLVIIVYFSPRERFTINREQIAKETVQLTKDRLGSFESWQSALDKASDDTKRNMNNWISYEKAADLARKGQYNADNLLEYI